MREWLTIDWLLSTALKLISFAAISGIALIADFCLFLLLVHFSDLPVDVATFVSAMSCCAFAFFTSTKRIFDYHGQFLMGLFLIYLVYQILLLSTVSWAVGFFVGLGLTAAFAKALTVPVTFCSNYLMIRFLSRPRGAQIKAE